MPEETVTTPQSAEPGAPATPPQEPKAEVQPQKPDTDWRAAYVGLQTTVNKLHARDEEIARREAEVQQTLRAIAHQTLGPEQAQKLEAQQRYQQERQAALTAAQKAEAYIVAQGSLFVDTLKAAGIDPADTDIDWARDARDVQEWQQRVGPSIQKKIADTIAKRISQAEEGIKAKTATEIKVEAEALAARAVKESGIDKVDTGKSGMTSKAKSVAEMNDSEFAAYSEQKRQERDRRRMQALR